MVVRSPQGLTRWLSRRPGDDGIRELSAPHSFGGDEAGEAAYADQFSVDDAYIDSVSRGLRRVLDDLHADRSGAALELGCGTGIFSRSLVRTGLYPVYVLTDMSPRFLRLTRDHLAAQNGAAVEYVVLSTEDIRRWPRRSLSLIALRYVLHHVLDWRGFLDTAARRLRPGGVLTFEEPCSDGYLLQMMLVDVLRRLPEVAESGEQVRRDLDFFVSTTKWYLSTGVDKAPSEDKHVFRVSEVVDVCRRAGLAVRFYPNLGYDALATRDEPVRTYFVDEFRHNLRVNFGFGEETMAMFERHLAPVCAGIADLSGLTMGPYVKGVFACRRPHRPVRRARYAVEDAATAGLRRAYRSGRRRVGAELRRAGLRRP
ncbi:MAG TPA: class I SAM-dependent methyltransferase [Candidatus Dormibacteraeota bacterium]|nr:class I SAM-dependent methyltransferase [Candidatus Dormibacteraeota bacterium]